MSLPIFRGVETPRTLVVQTAAFIARKGGGKTYGAKKAAEAMLAEGAQVIAVDVVGVWWGLRVGLDGRAAFDIPVFGGDHADLPLLPTSGARVAEVLVQTRSSAVLDVSGFSQADRKRFLTDFAEAFFHLKKKHRGAVHVFLEEAHKVVPQNPEPDERKMLGRWEDIARLGRNYGIGLTLVSQRPQTVNKEVLSQVELLAVGQITEDLGRKRIHDWVVQAFGRQEPVDLLKELPFLEVGEFFVYSPAWLKVFTKTRVLKLRSFDSSATPDMDAPGAEIRTKPIPVDKLRAAFVDVEAQAKANDPSLLRKEKAELERALKAATDELRRIEDEKDKLVLQLREKPQKMTGLTAADRRMIERARGSIARVAVVLEAARDGFPKALRNAEEIAKSLDASLAKALQRAAPSSSELLARIAPKVLGPDAARSRPASVRGVPAGMIAQGGSEYREQRGRVEQLLQKPTPLTRAEVGELERAHPSTGGNPSAYALKLVQTLAEREPMELTQPQLAILSGSSPKSGGFFAAIAELKRFGLATKEGKTFRLTAEGRARAGSSAAVPKTSDEVRAHWLRALPEYERALLTTLFEVPGGVTKEELAQKSGKSATSGGFFAAMATLKRNGLMVKNSDGLFMASEDLFR